MQPDSSVIVGIVDYEFLVHSSQTSLTTTFAANGTRLAKHAGLME